MAALNDRRLSLGGEAVSAVAFSASAPAWSGASANASVIF